MDDRHELIEIISNFYLEKFKCKGWKMSINKRLKKTYGTCCWETKTIEISATHISDDSLCYIIDTILHEIAHLLVGPDVEEHGIEFQNKLEYIRNYY
jgi:predicted SprT family Zn-dependent metalloprotease